MARITPSELALKLLDIDPNCQKRQTAAALNLAVVYIHSIPRSDWTDADQEIDDIEVATRPLNVESGWWA